ncbi:g3193 [Coccomyxa viridis]|uniref:G3193 protein n=1 Tax=Coccomyxa viridis TaxID=1274662 RepID=A0ABP1FPI1_9CHLO
MHGQSPVGPWTAVTQHTRICWRLNSLEPKKGIERRPCRRSAAVQRGSGQAVCSVCRRLQQVGMAVGSVGLSAAILLSSVQAAHAVTPEQLLFLEAWRAVDRAYVDKSFNGQSWFKLREKFLKDEDMSDTKATYRSIRKALATLNDPFTRFLEPAQFAALRRGTAGAVTGVGLEIGFESRDIDSRVVVITPSAGGPAERAGIEPQDVLLAIGDRPLQNVSLYEAGDLLQGTEGTEVVLKLQPHGQEDLREVTLKREKIKINPVTSQLCSSPSSSTSETSQSAEPTAASTGKIGYIRVSTFSKQTPENARSALQKLKADGADRFVLDVRNNGGGFFPAGVDVAKMLLSGGDIVLIADSQGVRDSYEADGTAVDSKSQLAVLVNRGTASASEVLAGALKDNGRARIVGERTFGKGLIQTIVELTDGAGVAVTVARYQTPAGTDINKVGIEPDVVLSADAMPPMDGPGFCKFVASADAPPLFGPAKNLAEEAALTS